MSLRGQGSAQQREVFGEVLRDVSVHALPCASHVASCLPDSESNPSLQNPTLRIDVVTIRP